MNPSYFTTHVKKIDRVFSGSRPKYYKKKRKIGVEL